ncbi:Hypothetical protein, putative [Bodo saltans]|uniref:Uncharacterized protein n=1 Tax=Bodo saltans TaxID=75058 RepID=A0A0S4JWH3_BODSA|nr:Hypothetical protein, putative [Bodo saltans]|eukprot:CUG93809.1 Hypothetical protein, putative [Bodo saltans]
MSTDEGALIGCCCESCCDGCCDICSCNCSCDCGAICSGLGSHCSDCLVVIFGDRCCCPLLRPELSCGFPSCLCDALPMCLTCLCYDAICEGLSGSHDTELGGACVTCECTSSLELLPCCLLVPSCGQLVTDAACCRLGRVAVSAPYAKLKRTTACWCCSCFDESWSPHGAWYAERRGRRDYIRNLRRHRVGSTLAAAKKVVPVSDKKPEATGIGNNSSIDAPLLLHAETVDGFIEIAEHPNDYQVNDDIIEMQEFGTQRRGDVDGRPSDAPAIVAQEIDVSVQSEQKNDGVGDSTGAVDEVDPLRVRADSVSLDVKPRRSFAYAPPPSQSMT